MGKKVATMFGILNILLCTELVSCYDLGPHGTFDSRGGVNVED